MANIKISELEELLTVADEDVLPIVDASGNETKKISRGVLKTQINNTTSESLDESYSCDYLNKAMSKMNEDIEKKVDKYDTGWVNLTLGSKFETYSENSVYRYRRIGNQVFINAVLKPTAAITGSYTPTNMFTLPTRCVPSAPLYFVMQGSGKATWLFSIIENKGGISRYGDGSTADDIPVSATLYINCTYFVD